MHLAIRKRFVPDAIRSAHMRWVRVATAGQLANHAAAAHSATAGGACVRAHQMIRTQEADPCNAGVVSADRDR